MKKTKKFLLRMLINVFLLAVKFRIWLWRGHLATSLKIMLSVTTFWYNWIVVMMSKDRSWRAMSTHRRFYWVCQQKVKTSLKNLSTHRPMEGDKFVPIKFHQRRSTYYNAKISHCLRMDHQTVCLIQTLHSFTYLMNNYSFCRCFTLTNLHYSWCLNCYHTMNSNSSSRIHFSS